MQVKDTCQVYLSNSKVVVRILSVVEIGVKQWLMERNIKTFSRFISKHYEEYKNKQEMDGCEYVESG